MEFVLNEDGSGYIVTGIGNCMDIYLVIPNSYNGLPVVSIQNFAFKGCSSIKSISVPKSITTIGIGAFCGCSSLQSIVLPFIGNSATSTSVTFGYVFGDTNYDGGVATDQSYSGSWYKTYYIPKSLESVTITSGSIPNYAFDNCTLITEIIIGEEVTSIGYQAFENCNSLKKLEIPPNITDVYLERLFINCWSLEQINVPFTNSVTLKKLFDGSYPAQIPSTLHTVVITSGEELAPYAFAQCSEVGNIELPKTLTTIGTYAFWNCSSINNITIPKNVDYIGKYAFVGCTSLEINMEEPYGWIVYSSSSATAGTEIDDFYTSHTYFVTMYLKSDYSKYIWKRDASV